MHDEALEVLPRVLDAAGMRRAVLIGHSDGGSIAAIHAGAAAGSAHLLGLVMIAAHFFVEDLNIASIRAITADYEQGDLRARLARYHRDVDVAFRGWNDAWLDPRFRAFDITDVRGAHPTCRCWRCRARTIRMAPTSSCACWSAARDVRWRRG